MCVADERTNILETNDAFEGLLEECRGRDIVGFFVEERLRDEMSPQMRHALDGTRVAFEAACATPAGTRLLSWSCRSADRLLVASVEDVAERDELRGALGRKSAEVDSILRALPDIYFRLDADGRIAEWHAQREGEFHVRQLQPDICVLLMSGHDAAETEESDDAWPLLDKPFTVQLLLSRGSEALATPVPPRHQGLEDAKERNDPDDVLTPGQGIFPTPPE
jgi:hypothetical protein